MAKHVPLRPRDYLILFSLVKGARHGYAIIRQVDEDTGGTVRIDPANLYRSVKRLTREGLLRDAEVEDCDDDGIGGERRRFLAVTELGRRVLTVEAARLARLTALATASGLIPDER